ncbi:hypothetical protein [Archaeoglobus sp.]
MAVAQESEQVLYEISVPSYGGGVEKPYARLSPEEVTVHKYKDQPGEWVKIYMVAKDPKGCSCEGTGATTQKISMFLEIPSGFEIRYSTEPTIFYREAESNRIWVDFGDVFSACCCWNDEEGYYARDWFEIRPLSDVNEGTYTLKLNWIASYTDAYGISQTNSGESEVKIHVVELISPELKRSASDTIDDAEDSITSAEIYIKSNSEKADMSAAMVILNQAKDYLEDAKDYYYNEEFDMAKSKASKAKNLAEKAKSAAEDAVKQAEEKARKEAEERAKVQMMIYALIGLIILVLVVAVGLPYWRKRNREKDKE